LEADAAASNPEPPGFLTAANESQEPDRASQSGRR